MGKRNFEPPSYIYHYQSLAHTADEVKGRLKQNWHFCLQVSSSVMSCFEVASVAVSRKIALLPHKLVKGKRAPVVKNAFDTLKNDFLTHSRQAQPVIQFQQQHSAHPRKRVKYDSLRCFQASLTILWAVAYDNSFQPSTLSYQKEQHCGEYKNRRMKRTTTVVL